MALPRTAFRYRFEQLDLELISETLRAQADFSSARAQKARENHTCNPVAIAGRQS